MSRLMFQLFSTGGSRMRAPLVAALIAIAASLLSSSRAIAARGEQSPPPATCIAIILPTVQGIEGSASDIGSIVRDLFGSYLTGPSIQVIPLQARLASQAIEEAKQQNCAHVLTATVTRKRSGGSAFGRVAGQAAGAASWSIPGGGTTKSAIARGAAIGTAQAVASLASNTRAKDELQLEYHVSSPAGVVEVKPTTDKLKAKVDGEDLLTPLVAKASEAIVGAIVK